MSISTIKRNTPNYKFPIPRFDGVVWQEQYERTLEIIDAAMFAIAGIGVNSGVWDNGTSYVIGDRAVDGPNGTLWQCEVNHASPASGTFADARTANPTYWKQITSAVISGGAWITAKKYLTNTFLQDGYRFGVTTQEFISGATFDADVTAGKIVVLIDITTAISTYIAQMEASLADDLAAAEASKVGAEAAYTSALGTVSAAQAAQAAAELARDQALSLVSDPAEAAIFINEVM